MQCIIIKNTLRGKLELIVPFRLVDVMWDDPQGTFAFFTSLGKSKGLVHQAEFPYFEPIYRGHALFSRN